MIKLHFTAGPLAGSTSELQAEFISIGRELDNVMTVPDGKMSRYHFSINKTQSGYDLVDNQATNGTYVNGERVSQSQALKPNDEVSAGNTSFRVDFSTASSDTLNEGIGRFYVQSPEGSFETEGDFITIGRSPDNHVHLDDSFISREHTHILYRDRHFYLRDNGSFNGTFLNNERIAEQQLKNGDKAQYGSFIVEFKLPTPNFLQVIVLTRSIEDEYGVAAANAMQDLGNARPQAIAEFDVPSAPAQKAQDFIPKNAGIDAKYATLFVDDIPKAVLESSKDKQKKRLNWEPTSDVLKDNRQRLYVGGSVASVLIVVFAMLLTGFQRPFMSRPLSAAHQSENFTKTENEKNISGCNSCHETFKGVSDEKCNNCHSIPWTPFGELHQSKAFKTEAQELGHDSSCATCHSEHRGEDKSPIDVAESTCMGCHKNAGGEAAPGYHDGHKVLKDEVKIPRSKETKKAPALSAADGAMALNKLHAKHANLEGYCVACHAPRPTKTLENQAGPAKERPARACLDCHTVTSSSTCLGCHPQHPGTYPSAKGQASLSLAPIGGLFLVFLFFAPAFVVYWQKKKRNELLPINPVRAQELLAQAKMVSNQPREKFTVIIKKDLCIGCSGCINSCPYDVLELDEATHKSQVVRADQCLGDMRCTKACPTGACVVIVGDKIPEVDRVKIDEYHQTNVAGLYVIGEASGKPLIKNAINQGKIAVDHIGSQPDAKGSNPNIYDVIVVGSGPGGLSAALACQERGLKYLLLEKASNPSDTIRNFPKAKIVLAEPVSIPLAGKLWMEDTNKETLIAKWEEIVTRTKLQLTLNQEVVDLSKQENIFTVQTNGNSYKGLRVILAPGTRGAPNKIGCPGEELTHPIGKGPRVMYQLSDGDLYRNKQCTILGGGDSAIEAALSLADAGAVVTMAYRRDKFERVKPRNVERFTDYVKQKKIKLYLLTVCKEIKPGVVVLKHERGTFEVKDSSFIAKGKPGEDQLPNDYIFALLGAQAPETFFKKCGIQTHKVPMA